MRVVLVSATELQLEQTIAGAPDSKAAVQVPVAEEILINMNEASNVVNEVWHPLKESSPLLRETPAVLSEIASAVKEKPVVMTKCLT
jgi:hypothetical protein